LAQRSRQQAARFGRIEVVVNALEGAERDPDDSGQSEQQDMDIGQQKENAVEREMLARRVRRFERGDGDHRVCEGEEELNFLALMGEHGLVHLHGKQKWF